MKKKNLIILTILIVSFLTFVSAAVYQEPWSQDQLGDQHNLTDMNLIAANIIETSELYVGNIYGLNLLCYQESANTSTSCGGLATGVYFNSSGWQNIANAYDRNWTTFANYTGNTTGYFYVNYSKPLTALSDSLWTIKRAVAINNYSIAGTCWAQSTLGFRGVVINLSDSTGLNYWQCFNGSNYINTTATQTGRILYEEAMVWRTSSNASLNASLDWINLKNYPVACPGSSAVTTLGDSSTCSDLWVDVAGDNITGNLNVMNVTVNGTSYLQLEMNLTAMICNEANAGAVYYNNNTNKHYGCNVTGWQVLY